MDQTDSAFKLSGAATRPVVTSASSPGGICSSVATDPLGFRAGTYQHRQAYAPSGRKMGMSDPANAWLVKRMVMIRFGHKR